MGPRLDGLMRDIALGALAAGQALPLVDEEAALARAVSMRVPSGAHVGNRSDGGSGALEDELAYMNVDSVCFLDNVKGASVERWLVRLEAKGIFPLLVFRPYFIPTNGIAPAVIQGYADGVHIRMREDFLRIENGLPKFPRIMRAYEEGRFIVKLFNETNIGGEGFLRGRAGFADALRCWKHARSVILGVFPKTKFLSICNTPGNDDVWFTGDLQNAAYWFHGREAAKLNPSQSEINAAIQSCPFREMFELCDFIGTHVYAPTEREVRGDLQTWYSRRHEQSLKFLKPYTDRGKKVIISECDMGYNAPEGQAKRAELYAWWLMYVIAPNEAITTVQLWWAADDGEADMTWEKHQTRFRGQRRPIVDAIARVTEGEIPVPPPDPIPNPPPGSDIQLPSWCTVNRVAPPAGTQYWHLKRAFWQDSDTSGGKHHIYALEPHDPTCIMYVQWGDTTDAVSLDKPATEPAGNYAMYGAEYKAWIEGRGTRVSDSVSGMKLPQNQHVVYYLEWELKTVTTTPNPPPTDEGLKTLLLAEAERRQVLQFNPTAALQKVIFADNLDRFTPNSPEFFVTYNGRAYVAQRAENGRGRVRVYYAPTGTYTPVLYVERGT